MKLTALPALALLTALASHAFAGPLKEAKINQIVNDVKLIEPRQGARPAILQEVVKDDLGVATGVQSRAELIFQDTTLTRLGAETFFSFQPGTRDLNLERGSMLLQVPKGLGGARIRAASVTASITGTTVMVDYLAGGSIKLTVLEGSMNVTANTRPEDRLALRAGKQVIVNPDAKSLPVPTDVNLRTLMRDSVLINPVLFKGKSKLNVAALPSVDLIEKEIALQEAPGAGAAQVAAVSKSDDEDATVAPSKTISPLFNGEILAVSPARTETPLTTTIFTPVLADPTPVAPTSNKDPLPPVLTDPTPTLPPDNSNPVTGPVPDTRTLPDPGPITPPTPPTTPPPSTPPSPVDPLTTAGFFQPDWSATKTTAPFAPVNTPPVTTILPATLIFGGSGAPATFDLTGPLPQLTLGTQSMTGAIYGGAAVDGSAAMFAFSTPIDFDAQVKFDSRFGIGSEPAAPAGGVAMFRFVDSLTLGGSPAFTTNTGGVRDLALIVGTNVGSATIGGALELSGLHSLTLATANGGINLGNNLPVTATAGSGFKFLHLYASGSLGSVTLQNAVNLPGSGLFVDAQNKIVVTNLSNVNVDHAAFNARRDIIIKGQITADTLQFNAKGAMTLSDLTLARRVSITAGSFTMLAGSVEATTLDITTTGDIAPGESSVIKAGALTLKAGGKLTLNTSNPLTTRLDLSSTTHFQAEGKGIVLGGDVFVPAGTLGTIKGGSDGISGANFSLGGFDSVASAKDIKVRDLETRSLTAAGNVTVNGDLRATTVDVAGSLSVVGTISPRVGDAVTTLYVLKAGGIDVGGGLAFKGVAGTLATAPSAGGQAYLDVSKAKFGGSNAVTTSGTSFDGGDALPGSSFEGGNGGMLNVGTDLKPIAGKIEVNGPISASTGANAAGVATGGTGGTVNLVSSDSITIASTVKVSDSTAGKASKQGGNIRVESRKTSATAIDVKSSGQLLSMLAAAAPGPGGKIEFVSAGGDILVNGGTVTADKGTVDIRNHGAGKVALTNANIRGDVVKIGALGANGQLIIGGGTISADTSLKLYGGTSNGEVRFTDNVTLGGESTKIIAGKTVTIDNTRTVTIGGSSAAKVYTDTANYTGSGGNGSTTGKFGGKGATTQGFSNRPAF